MILETTDGGRELTIAVFRGQQEWIESVVCEEAERGEERGDGERGSATGNPYSHGGRCNALSQDVEIVAANYEESGCDAAEVEQLIGRERCVGQMGRFVLRSRRVGYGEGEVGGTSSEAFETEQR